MTTTSVPEQLLERELVRLGLAFEPQVRGLAGTPDFVLTDSSIAVFVHGCYWHRHAGCARRSMPRSNLVRWIATFRTNVARDQAAIATLRSTGMPVFLAWECHLLQDSASVADRLSMLHDSVMSSPPGN